MSTAHTATPWPDDDMPRNTAELQAYLMADRFIKSKAMEQQPDGSVTAVQPDDALTTEEEKEAFMALIEKERQMKLDAHDDLVANLRADLALFSALSTIAGCFTRSVVTEINERITGIEAALTAAGPH